MFDKDGFIVESPGQAPRYSTNKMLNAKHTEFPRVMTVDKHPGYQAAFDYLKIFTNKLRQISLRQCQYLNNIIEQDHRRIKKKTKSSMGYHS